MTLAEKLKAEGRQEGLDEAKVLIANNLLRDGIDPRLLAKNTDLPLETVLEIQKSQAL